MESDRKGGGWRREKDEGREEGNGGSEEGSE